MCYLYCLCYATTILTTTAVWMIFLEFCLHFKRQIKKKNLRHICSFQEERAFLPAALWEPNTYSMSCVVACVHWHILRAVELQATTCLQVAGTRPVVWRNLSLKPKSKMSKLLIQFFFTENEGVFCSAYWTAKTAVCVLESGRAVANRSRYQFSCSGLLSENVQCKDSSSFCFWNKHFLISVVLHAQLLRWHLSSMVMRLVVQVWIL